MYEVVYIMIILVLLKLLIESEIKKFKERKKNV